MNDAKVDLETLQLRGRVHPRSPLYTVLKASDKSMVKTMIELAEEGLAVRSLFRNGVQGHPHEQYLKELGSAEAVAFLLGVSIASFEEGKVSGEMNLSKKTANLQLENLSDEKIEQITAGGEVLKLKNRWSFWKRLNKV